MDTSEDANQKIMRQIAPHELPRLATQQVSQNPTERLLSGKVTDFREAMELYIKQYDQRETGTDCVSNHYQVAAQIALRKYNNCMRMEVMCDEVEAREQTLEDLYMEIMFGDQATVIKNELEIIRDALEHEDYATLAM